MTDDFIDRVYRTTGQDEMRALYDDWAAGYDADLEDSAYKTPGRVAEALSAALADKNAPVLDFACGTGLSGVALADAGFKVIDGADISDGMLEEARRKGVYRHLIRTRPDQPLPVERGAYRAITAVGAISVGAAPGALYDELVDLLAPGGLRVLSLNDRSIALEDYGGRLKASIEAGKVRKLSEETGPHLVHDGKTTQSTVYVLERRA